MKVARARHEEGSSSDVGDRHALYFKWFVSALVLIYPVLTVLAGASASDAFGYLGRYSLVTGALFMLGVRTSTGIWITGSLLLVIASLGWIFFAVSEQEMSFLWVIVSYPLAAVLTVVAALVDSFARIRSRRHGHTLRARKP